MKSASVVAVVFLSIVSLAHLLRFLLRIEVLIGGTVVPVWMSLIGCVVSGMIAIALGREIRRP